MDAFSTGATLEQVLESFQKDLQLTQDSVAEAAADLVRDLSPYVLLSPAVGGVASNLASFDDGVDDLASASRLETVPLLDYSAIWEKEKEPHKAQSSVSWLSNTVLANTVQKTEGVCNSGWSVTNALTNGDDTGYLLPQEKNKKEEQEGWKTGQELDHDPPGCTGTIVYRGVRATMGEDEVYVDGRRVGLDGRSSVTTWSDNGLEVIISRTAEGHLSVNVGGVTVTRCYKSL